MGVVKPVRKPEERDARRLQKEAFIHLTSKHHSTQSLAQALAVSVATVSRVISHLRQEGVEIKSMKNGGQYYYEVEDARSVANAWQKDPFVKCIGFIKGKRRPRGETVDSVVYDRG